MLYELIAISLPFGLAIVLQLLSSNIQTYAERATKVTLPSDFDVGPEVKKLCVNLAVHVYLHLSFVFGVLMASFSCITLTVLAKRPILAAVAGAATLILIPLWLLRWQSLSALDLQGKKGKPMRISAWFTIIILWALTIYAWFYPTVPSS